MIIPGQRRIPFGSRGGLADSHRGFSRLELMVTVLVLAILATVLLERFFYYQELAEKAAMEYTISRVKSGLRLRMASMMVAGRAQDFSLLAADNPVNWLESRPGNYAGEIDGLDSKAIQSGNWYFDKSSHSLIYFVRHGKHFQTDGADPNQVRIKIVAVPNKSDGDKTQVVDGPADSVIVELSTPYKWF